MIFFLCVEICYIIGRFSGFIGWEWRLIGCCYLCFKFFIFKRLDVGIYVVECEDIEMVVYR